MKSVKIGAREYAQLKALAVKRGQFITYHLNLAIRAYIRAEREAKQQEYAGGQQ